MRQSALLLWLALTTGRHLVVSSAVPANSSLQDRDQPGASQNEEERRDAAAAVSSNNNHGVTCRLGASRENSACKVGRPMSLSSICITLLGLLATASALAPGAATLRAR